MYNTKKNMITIQLTVSTPAIAFISTDATEGPADFSASPTSKSFNRSPTIGNRFDMCAMNSLIFFGTSCMFEESAVDCPAMAFPIKNRNPTVTAAPPIITIIAASPRRIPRRVIQCTGASSTVATIRLKYKINMNHVNR